MEKFKIVRTVQNGESSFKIKKRFFFCFYLNAKIPTANYTSFLKNSLTVTYLKWNFPNEFSARFFLNYFLITPIETKGEKTYWRVACNPRVKNRFKYFLIDRNSETDVNVFSKFIGIWSD